MKTGAFRASLAALALLVPALSACGESEQPERPAAAPAGPRLVLRREEAPIMQDVPAEVATLDQADVIARIGGILSALNVRAGDKVARGQVIARITDSQLGYQAGAYGAQAAAAAAQAHQAEADLARVRFLHDNGVYAPARLDQAEAALASARAQVRAARAQQAAVSAVAGQGAVIAPASGRVLRADIPAGAPVAPGMVIAVVTSGPTILRLTMPESVAEKVRPGARVWADGAGTAAGRVIRVYPAVSAGQVSADVDLPGIDASLIGRRVAARVAAGTRPALLVPAGFVSSRFGIDYVTVLARDGSAAEVPVQTARSAEAGMLEVLSGVDEGDTLIGKPNAAAGK